MTRVYSNGDGTVRVSRERSVNELSAFEDNEIVRLPYDAPCPDGDVAWDAEAFALVPADPGVVAAREAARIQCIVDAHGVSIMQLASLLRAFGLSMPVTLDEAVTAVYSGWKGDDSRGADAMLLLTVYNRISASVCDADIHAAARKMGVV